MSASGGRRRTCKSLLFLYIFSMVAGPATSTLRWAQKEAKPIAQGACLIFQSQLGYQGRKAEKKCSKKMLQMVVGGGTVVDPLNPVSTTQQFKIPELTGIFSSTTSKDALERANVVAVGIQSFATLLAKGRYPGSGGYTINEAGEKVFEKRGVGPDSFVTELLPKIAQFVAQGAIPLPLSALPTLEKLGQFMSQKRVRTTTVRKPAVEVEAKAVDYDPTLTEEEEKFLVDAAKSVGDYEAARNVVSSRTAKVYRPSLPKDYRVDAVDRAVPLENSKESSVPSSRIGRLATFGQLAFGLAGGAVAEITKRTFGMVVMQEGQAINPFLSQQNADRIVQTLCRVRGAALKLGQMLSIQDSDTVPQALLEIFERVRHSADFMPLRQVTAQMSTAFGPDWKTKFASFEDRPFAAASIGQVHKATLHDGRTVAVKIQYPGVAEGIDSDIDNLVSVLSVGGLFPKGMFLDSFVKVARRELRQECDYKREARAIREFRRLIADSKDFFIPDVVDELSSDRVLTTEFIVGKPVDQCLDEPQVVRDYIAGKFVELCLKEIFEWRFMQTDPNWSNFYLGSHPTTGEPRLVLLDFGASRPYPKKFVDKYMQIIKAAYDEDDQKILEYSREIGFLTGYESEIMEKAHVESVRIMGETLTSTTPYDFSQQKVTKRIHKLVPVMLEHRLTSPPEEIYSLHRKLSGSYLLATKLKATVSCGGLFSEINRNYRYGDDDRQIDIDYA